jgi:hypothetical protein
MTNGSNGTHPEGKRFKLACGECELQAGFVMLEFPGQDVQFFLVHPPHPEEPHAVGSDPPINLNMIDMR